MAKKAEPKKPAAAKPKAAAKPAAAKAAAPKVVAAKVAAPKAVAAPAKAAPVRAAPLKKAAPVAAAPVQTAAPETVVKAVMPEAHEGVRRRDFINVAAASFAGVGAVAIVLPLINQMNPSADVLADASTEIDLSQIQPGQTIKTIFRKQPLFVRHLTPAEIVAADKTPAETLRDPQTLEQRTQPGKTQWLITMGVCTHLGCVPMGAAQGEVKGEFGGYFCPCHGSHYDTAGRIRKGPAPTNLMVPEYTFISDTVVQVG